MKNPVSYRSAPVPGLCALSCAGDYHFTSHIHSGHVIWLNSLGSEHFSFGGNSDILQPGSISIIEPGVVHSNYGCEEGKRYLRSLYLEDIFFTYIEELITGHPAGRFQLATSMLTNGFAWQQLLSLHESIALGKDKMIIEQILLDLFPALLTASSPGAVPGGTLQSSRQVLSPVVAFMHDNLGAQIELADFAKVIDCTPYHVIRLFKKHIGMSPHAYLVQLRLERARSLLENKYSIADAALLSGFADQSHLTRKFKSRYGMTPGVYVRSLLM